MRPAPFPPNETERLQRLDDYLIIDSQSERAYDDIARLAAYICATPIALVSFVARDRQWFKARIGLDAVETSRDVSFCAHAILDTNVMTVEDATRDERFADNPLVIGDPNVRFYAGAPLLTDSGHALGTLCVIDREARVLTSEQQQLLQALARQVILQLERRRHVTALEKEIVDREAAASALREAETRFRQILDALPLGVFVVDRNGTPTFANSSAVDILGRGIVPSVGRDDLATVYQVYVAGTESLYPIERMPIVKALQGQAITATDIEIRHSSKHVLLEVSGTPVVNDAGEIVSGAAVFTDITHQRREARRLELQHMAAAVLAGAGRVRDAIPDLLRGACTSMDCSVGMVWTIDATRQRLVPFAHWTDAEKESVDFATQRSTTTWRHGEGLPGEVWATKKTRWVERQDLFNAVVVPVSLGAEPVAVMEFFGRRLEQPDDELLATLATIGNQVANFMERRHAERVLRLSESRTRSIIDSMHGALVTLREDGTIESINRSATRVFGYSEAELSGRRVDVLFSPRDMPNVFAEMKAQPELPTQWEGRRKDGQTFPLEATVFQFATPAGPRWALDSLDVSERREVDRLKQEFVSTVSHELRTPLTSIRGSLGLLAAGALGDLPSEALDVIAIAERNTVRLITLINDILDLDRLESGRVELQLASEEIGPLLKRAVEAVGAFAAEHHVEIKVESSETTALLDGDRILQVLVNLISNAIKFSPAHSSVSVTARPVDGWLEVHVIDSGRGIPASHHNKIFERFRQVEASDARRQSGTGLGLAICRSIVEHHGGSIGVESELGRGSTFKFRIPLAGDRQSRSAAVPTAEDVLLVEDSEELAAVLKRALARGGLETRVAHTCREAIRMAIARAPALIVLDVSLPDGDGFEVVDLFRRNDRLRNLPVLVYTGHDLTEGERERLRLGDTRFLTKAGHEPDDFVRVVTELYRNRASAGRH